MNDILVDECFSVASRKLGNLLGKVAANKHFQRIAGLKPVAGVIEKLSHAEIGAKVELTSFSGMMTVSELTIERQSINLHSSLSFRSTFRHHPVIVSGKTLLFFSWNRVE